MATKQILASLAAEYLARTGTAVRIESVGGVDAARRVASSASSGEMFDIVLLASDAIDKLIVAGHVQQGSRVDWALSPVAIAVPSHATPPDISSEAAVRAAVLAAPTLSYSTGPSGVYLNSLFERWGIAQQVQSRLIVPPPGTSVASLIASGQAALGFQQQSEMLGVPGIQILGQLPSEIAYITTFSSGIPTRIDAAQSHAVQAFQRFLTSADTQNIKASQGMYGCPP